MHANCIGSRPDTPAFNRSATTPPPHPPAVGIPRLPAQTFLTLFWESGATQYVVTHRRDRDTSVNMGEGEQAEGGAGPTGALETGAKPKK